MFIHFSFQIYSLFILYSKPSLGLYSPVRNMQPQIPVLSHIVTKIIHLSTCFSNFNHYKFVFLNIQLKSLIFEGGVGFEISL